MSTRKKKGMGFFSFLQSKAKKINVSQRKGCVLRKAEGNKNNIPFIVFFCGILCRLSYEYPPLFDNGIKFVFNMKVTEMLNGNLYQKLSERSMNGGDRTASDTVNRIENKLTDRINFPVNSAQSLALIVNSALEYMSLNRKSFKNGTKTFNEIYSAMPNIFMNNTGDVRGLSYIYIATGGDLNCYLVYDKKSNILFLIFRGTMSAKTTIMDARATRVTITSGDRNETNRRQYGQVHGGFLTQLRHVIHRLAYAMKKITLNSNTESINLIVTGHSLGAATATIFSYFWASWKNKICALLDMQYLNGNFSLITWGSPRVGTGPFKDEMERLIDSGVIKHVRAKSDGDIISEIPGTATRFMNIGGDRFRHIKIPLQCNSTLKLNNYINYNRPLQCSYRKSSCSIKKGLIAHNNYAYVNNMGVVRTFSAGHNNNRILWKYVDFDTGEHSTGKINNYRVNDVLSFPFYQREFSGGDVITTNAKSFDADGKRVNTETEFGVGMYGKKPSGFLNRFKKTTGRAIGGKKIKRKTNRKKKKIKRSKTKSKKHRSKNFKTRKIKVI